MRRTPHDNKDSEKVWCYPVVPYSSPDGASELHAVKQKDTLQTHHADEPSTIEEEYKNDKNPFKAFVWRFLGVTWRACRSILHGLMFMVVICMIHHMMYGQDRAAVAEHSARVTQTRSDIWHAFDWESEARGELMAATNMRDMAEGDGRILADRRVNKAQLKYDEVHEKRMQVEAAIKAQGLYPELKHISEEDYQAGRGLLSPDFLIQGRAALEARFPFNPSRLTEIDEGDWVNPD